MIKPFVIFGALLLALYWTGNLLGDLHAAYQIRKHEREQQ